MKRTLDQTDETDGVVGGLRTDSTARRSARVFSAGVRLAAVVVAGVLVSACTAVPDWANPVDWLEEDAPPPERISASKDLEQAQSGDFPNLASVPDEPRTATPAGERKAIAKGLAADRANAQYSGERLVASNATATGAPTVPAVARNLGAASTQVAVPAPAAPVQAASTPAKTPATPPSATRIAPSPALTPAPGAQAAPPATAAVAPLTAPRAPRASELAAIVYFADGSHVLDANDRNILRDVVALSRERNARIRVIGHASARTGNTDPVKHRMANLEISQRRAETVAAALVGMGAARERVRAEARADTLPVYHEFMPSGEAGNRRTEIFLEY